MAAKGGVGLCFSHVVPKKQWASQPPLTLRLVGYRKSFIFYAFLHDLATIDYGK